MTTKKDPPEEGSGPAHMSDNSYGSIIPLAPPIQIRDNPEHKGCLFDQESGLEVHHVKGTDLPTEDSKPSAGYSKAQRIAEYKQLLDSLPEKRIEAYSIGGLIPVGADGKLDSKDIPWAANTGYNEALDQCRAIILKKLEGLK